MPAALLFCFKKEEIFVLSTPTRAVPPDIVDSESSGDVMVTEGQNTTLRCSASGHPLPTIHWRREDNRPFHNHGKCAVFILIFDFDI